MKHFDLLETKRKHVRKYSDKIPEKQLEEKWDIAHDFNVKT